MLRAADGHLGRGPRMCCRGDGVRSKPVDRGSASDPFCFLREVCNLEWAVFEREIDLSDLFARTEDRLRDAASDDEAKAVVDRLTRILGDGHVRVDGQQVELVSASRQERVHSPMSVRCLDTMPRRVDTLWGYTFPVISHCRTHSFGVPDGLDTFC